MEEDNGRKMWKRKRSKRVEYGVMKMDEEDRRGNVGEEGEE